MITIAPELLERTERLLATCRASRLTIVTAESCTGGLIAGVLTAVAGSSDVVDRGFVTYSNDAKAGMLGVPGEVLTAHGAVSEPVARAMANGALAHSAADLSIAVTGIAGPGGGSASKPVGLVHLAAAARDGRLIHERIVFDGDRATVRARTVALALDLLDQLAS
ncbi:MAG TPA: CinA family protein [Geminicoccus sp.]|jgi:nicotinamide-nucleotide amidase|uniref:CinA family protein n=1 Tax=Geminicoccus sp. TaxID=2024832 RepID=UPI002E34D6F3|nr:CinA family protein [Geminicoccus sp.]HEX2527814.1 CinA family protein [Geminicoccus sp.]